jgi:cytochrome c biogenesis protein ResB
MTAQTNTPNPHNRLALLLSVALLLLWIIGCCSCRSVNKTASSNNVKVDSAVQRAATSVNQAKIDRTDSVADNHGSTSVNLREASSGLRVDLDTTCQADSVRLSITPTFRTLSPGDLPQLGYEITTRGAKVKGVQLDTRLLEKQRDSIWNHVVHVLQEKVDSLRAAQELELKNVSSTAVTKNKSTVRKPSPVPWLFVGLGIALVGLVVFFIWRRRRKS